ncbi:MAG TPA: phage tail tape measure protein [Paracoccaceae bacterium]|nr:phage tail tape measure protein [Paracoccaceae bacterium]
MADLEIEAGLDELSAGFGTAQGFTSAFREELSRVQAEMRGTDREARSLSKSMGSSLRSAFEGLVFDGERVSDVLRDVGRGLATTLFSSAIQPVHEAIGSGVQSLVGGGLSSLFGGILPFAKGGVVNAGRVRAFASGGVVDGPTWFGMRGGLGLMGEAGPEAILPLARGADGRLGVRGAGGGAVHVSMQVTSPDVEGFRRSQTQIAANVARALKRGQRNL